MLHAEENVESGWILYIRQNNAQAESSYKCKYILRDPMEGEVLVGIIRESFK